MPVDINVFIDVIRIILDFMGQLYKLFGNGLFFNLLASKLYNYFIIIAKTVCGLTLPEPFFVRDFEILFCFFLPLRELYFTIILSLFVLFLLLFLHPKSIPHPGSNVNLTTKTQKMTWHRSHYNNDSSGKTSILRWLWKNLKKLLPSRNNHPGFYKVS